MAGIRECAQAYRQLAAIPPFRRRAIREAAGIRVDSLARRLGMSTEKVSSFEEDYTPGDDMGLAYWAALKEMIPDAEEEKLTEEERRNVIAHFNAGETCKHCYGIHARACPRVRRLRFAPEGGGLTEVEFWADGEWPKDNVLFKDSPQLRELEDNI